MLDKILAVSGKSGLFRYIARGHNALIVETLDDTHKRQTIFASEKAVALNDISVYTNDGQEKPLWTLLENAKVAYNAQPAPLHHKKSPDADIMAFFSKVLPDYDPDRVKISDMRKALQWYNALVAAGITDFAPEEETAAEQPGKANPEAGE